MSDVTDQYVARAKQVAEDQYRNLEFFKVPHAGIETIRSKLAMKIFEEYTNILKGMYSTRFNGKPADRDDSMKTQSVPCGHTTIVSSHKQRSPSAACKIP